LVAVGLGITWTQRENIAIRYIDGILNEAEVEAGYEIFDIGLGRQRIRNLVIGDPDLTVKQADIYLQFGFDYPEISRVVAHGVRLSRRLT